MHIKEHKRRRNVDYEKSQEKVIFQINNPFISYITINKNKISLQLYLNSLRKKPNFSYLKPRSILSSFI